MEDRRQFRLKYDDEELALALKELVQVGVLKELEPDTYRMRIQDLPAVYMQFKEFEPWLVPYLLEQKMTLDELLGVALFKYGQTLKP